ncbi:abscisic acid ABA receptor [Colletotrichum chrysophilum]|uniref:Abscisic acid ABA receptor n=1 Tax=Colletotrichum chrysophilum TaxID=1836956 RepID=A0AAD9A6J4_9PEZI|nr:abscisic acid ABA receptor [Colletotrichum chrysophilum]
MNNPLLGHLSKILTLSPPQSSYPSSALSGPLTSHTGTAYLFLSISSAFPRLQIHSYHAIHWARAYISNIPTQPASDSAPEHVLGLSETLASPAIRACISQDLAHVHKFLSLLPSISHANLPTCLIHGLSGTLYLLRLIRHWVPSSAPLVSRAIVHISEYLLSSPWSCPQSRYHGAADGDLGTLTQLVLTTPPLASRLVERLAALLDLQGPDGEWPSQGTEAGAESLNSKRDVSFAQGTTGLIISLLSLRPFFSSLQERIDDAMAKARNFLSTQELGAREPSLWYGALSTPLAFPKGPSRTSIVNLVHHPRSTSEPPSDSSTSGSIAISYDPGAAWMWGVSEKELPRMIFYNDI